MDGIDPIVIVLMLFAVAAATLVIIAFPGVLRARRQQPLADTGKAWVALIPDVTKFVDAMNDFAKQMSAMTIVPPQLMKEEDE